MNEDLKNFMDFLVKGIASEPDKAYCQVVKNNDILMVEIYCDEKDKGRLIGKGGRTIKDLKNLSRLWGAINRQRVEVSII